MGSRVLPLALAFVLLGSGIAVAAAGGPRVADANVGDPNVAQENPVDGLLHANSVSEAMAQIYAILMQYGLQIIGALVILALGRWLAKVLAGFAAKLMRKAKVDPTLIPFLENLSYTAVLVFVVIAVLDRLGVQTAQLIAVLGAAGLAVGLALQGSLSNFASGVLLLIFKPFRVGDFVETAGAKGTVQAIHLFNTILNSPDNIRVIVPNAQVTGGSILNYTINGTRRIDLVASISYEDDIKKARRVIQGVLASDPRILPEPAPLIVVGETAESSINFFVRPWVKVADYWDVYFDLTEKLKLAIEEHGMTIPFPQQDVNIKTAAPVASLKSA